MHDVSAFFFQQLLNGDVRVLDERLAFQRYFTEQFFHRTFDHLLDDVRRFAALLGFGAVDFVFLVKEILRQGGSIQRNRIAGGDVHGDIFGEFNVASGDFHQHADFLAVQIMADDAASGGQGYKTADGHVFANFCHQFATALVSGNTRCDFSGVQRVNVGEFLRARHFGKAVGKTTELVTHGNEVGFAVGFEDGCFFGVVADRDDQRTFSSHAAGFLVGLGQTGFAHIFNSGFNIAIGFEQCFLALHHACAGTFAQLFH